MIAQCHSLPRSSHTPQAAAIQQQEQHTHPLDNHHHLSTAIDTLQPHILAAQSTEQLASSSSVSEAGLHSMGGDEGASFTGVEGGRSLLTQSIVLPHMELLIAKVLCCVLMGLELLTLGCGCLLQTLYSQVRVVWGGVCLHLIVRVRDTAQLNQQYFNLFKTFTPYLSGANGRRGRARRGRVWLAATVDPAACGRVNRLFDLIECITTNRSSEAVLCCFQSPELLL